MDKRHEELPTEGLEDRFHLDFWRSDAVRIRCDGNDWQIRICVECTPAAFNFGRQATRRIA